MFIRVDLGVSWFTICWDWFILVVCCFVWAVITSCFVGWYYGFWVLLIVLLVFYSLILFLLFCVFAGLGLLGVTSGRWVGYCDVILVFPLVFFWVVCIDLFCWFCLCYAGDLFCLDCIRMFWLFGFVVWGVCIVCWWLILLRVFVVLMFMYCSFC